MLLRAVRFLDTMIQRDNLQKAAFLKDLGSIWPRVDARVLKFRMIPPLLAEARTEALQPVLLPLLLAMVEKQDDEASTSPPSCLLRISVMSMLGVTPDYVASSGCSKALQRVLLLLLLAMVEWGT